MTNAVEVISTSMGQIEVQSAGDGSQTVVFMHGIFMDRSLWSSLYPQSPRRRHIYLDMPGHGNSGNVGRKWTLEDCTTMIFEVMDKLHVSEAVLIGHSWGAMVALQAAVKRPSRVVSLGLFNMPHRRVAGLARIGFRLQKWFVRFPNFYAAQAAKELYTAAFLKAQPEVVAVLQRRLRKRPAKELARLIDAVLLWPTDATELIASLKVPATCVIGEQDYVGQPTPMLAKVVPGGHVSPAESPSETKELVEHVARLCKEGFCERAQ
jgi:3-oxoadipate enol-lactonase